MAQFVFMDDDRNKLDIISTPSWEYAKGHARAISADIVTVSTPNSLIIWRAGIDF